MEIWSVLTDLGSSLDDPTRFASLAPHSQPLASIKGQIEEQRIVYDKPIYSLWLDICNKILRDESKYRPRASELLEEMSTHCEGKDLVCRAICAIRPDSAGNTQESLRTRSERSRGSKRRNLVKEN